MRVVQSANVAFKLLHRLGGAEAIGPILMGLGRPVQLLQQSSEVQDVVNTLPGVEDGKVTLVWEPPWDPKTMASDYAKDKMNIW